MSSKGRKVADDLNLSLTGAGIHSAASTNRSRPGSAKRPKRPNSASSDVTKEKSQPRRPGSGHGDQGMPSNRSGFSDISSVSTSKRRPGGTMGKTPSDDFLALFESTVPPKIKSTSKASSSSSVKGPSPNAVKVLWSEPGKKTLKNKFTPKTANSSTDQHHKPQQHKQKPAFDDDDTWLTAESNSHTIFKQMSARSSSDEELSSLRNQLSESINKSQKLIAAAKNGKHDGGGDESPRDSARSRNGGSKDQSNQSAITNNMTLQGRTPSVKVGLSDLENSYQNIKHKTPVNETRKTSTKQSGGGHSGANALAEDYIKTLNMSATKIQRWFRRLLKAHQTSEAAKRAGEAAIQRLLTNKKQAYEEQRLRESQVDLMSKDVEDRRVEDRKKIREEKAKEARHEAIKELQKKREEKRQDIKKKAEEEIAYLQANGKITKPIKTGIGKKKGTKPTPKRGGSDKHPNINTREDSSPEHDVERGQDDSMEEYYRNHLHDGGSHASSTTTGDKRDNDAGSQVVPSESATTNKSNLDDLFETLKKLEEEEHLVSARPDKKMAWLDELEKGRDGDSDTHSLNAENLQRLNHGGGGPGAVGGKVELPTKSSLLSDDKMKSIMAFLDEVQVTERLSTVDQEISKLSVDLDRAPPLGPSAEELAELDQANAAASEVTNTVLSQRLQLDEKTRTVSMLQKALNQQRELTVRHAKETDREMKRRLDVQKDEYEETIKRHLSFIDQLIDDKKQLSEKCESLVKELKQVDKKYQDRIKAIVDKHSLEMQRLKDMHEAAEKLRREKWIDEKTKKIKEMTVKGLEPEIQRLIAKHKSEIKKIKQIQEAELLESDERAAQKYVRMTEELRDQLADEKESACARERELAKQRYEKQVQQEEEAYQQQRRRMLAEVQEEKDRLAGQASRQRLELDKLQQQLQEKHTYALDAMKTEFDKARAEQEKRHETETRELKERVDREADELPDGPETETRELKERVEIEKQTWEENYRKKQENYLMSKERQLKDGVKKERNKEIELVIRQLEQDATTARQDCERVAENRIKRMREKYEMEMKGMEGSERQAMERYNEMKARLTEVEGDSECVKVQLKQKDQEIKDLQKLTDKMHKERDRVSDIVRQEFADRLVFTEEENRRVKTELSELRARQRLELERAKEDMEQVKRSKDEEMEEVHKRVKSAIVKKEEVVNQLKQQYQAALKRADHLEGLLQQQRKQLLGK